MRKAFSLMELMVVIVILGLLAAFVLPSLTQKGEDAKKSLVCVQMKSVSQALKMYKIDKSTYPSTEEGLKILLQQNYFENNKLPKDSWGNSFLYILEENGFDLISLGADKKESTSDDIYFSKCN